MKFQIYVNVLMIMDLNAKNLNNFHYAEFSLKFFNIDEIVQNQSLNELV